MAKTRIEWAEVVWNPVSGCTPISEGCQNCYAKRMANRLRGRCGYPADEPFKVTLHEDRLGEPLRWKKPRRVFVCSMGDLFHESVPESWILAVYTAMEKCPQHTFLLLTKRIHIAAEVLNKFTGRSWPLPNVWLGVTAENQQRADERIPILLQIPAAVRFVSIEPMLGPVNLNFIGFDGVRPISAFGRCSYHTHLYKTECLCNSPRSVGIDWVICGGETGPGARPMHPEWVRSLRDQCQAAGISFFLKSWGEYCFPSQMPEETYQALQDRYNLDVEIPWKVGKKAAGRILDGQIWDEMPEI